MRAMVYRVVSLRAADLAECEHEGQCVCEMVRAAAELVPDNMDVTLCGIELRNAEGDLVMRYDGNSWTEGRSLTGCELSKQLFFVVFVSECCERSTVLVEIEA